MLTPTDDDPPPEIIDDYDTDPIDEGDPIEEPMDDEFAKCAHCSTPIVTCGPLVCWGCACSGHCTVCGGAHRPTQCPLVRAERIHQAEAERAIQRGIIAAAALAVRERYEAQPVWMEAA